MPNNIELVRICRAMIGNPYWYGTYGQIGSEQLLSDCAKRYPNQFSKKRIETAKARGDFGKRVMDCSGLIKNVLMGGTETALPSYDSKYDLSANSMHTKATEKGSIADMPEVVGLGLWKNNHVGVYIGGGKCIEAKGFVYGVIESDVFNDTAFVEWFKIPFIEYIEESGSSEASGSDEGASPVVPDGMYAVVPGDTLSALASKWDCTVEEIVILNGIENPDLIVVGQILRVPKASGSSEASESPVWIGTVATNKDPLRVRSSKSTANNDNVVRLLPKGSQVDLIGDNDGGWYKLADGTGYVAAKFISR